MRQLTLTAEQRKELHKRIRQTKDRKTADRLRVILFKADGCKNHIIAHMLQMDINTTGRLYLVLDNVSYQKAQRVQEQAVLSQITLKYLPPSSPSLNLIERLWKFMRKTIFKDKYRST